MPPKADTDSAPSTAAPVATESEAPRSAKEVRPDAKPEFNESLVRFPRSDDEE